MMRSRSVVWLASFSAVVLLLSGCDGVDNAGADTTLAATTTTIPVTTTTTGETTTKTTAPVTSAPISTTATGSDSPFTEMEGFTYLTIEGQTFEGDMYVPEGDGPWPVVVMFHGNYDTKDGYMTADVAEAAAAAGMQVFVPNWLTLTGVTGFTPASFDVFYAVANCAVAYAQPDPDASLPVVVYGFSAGVGPASRAALDPATGPIPGCVADNPPAPITGAVLGDGEYFLQSRIFDEPFAEDLEAMQALVATMVDPNLWPTDMKTQFFLWVADDGTAPRSLNDPRDETGWLAQRDPDGSIRDDLDRLDQLDDPVITFIEQGELMALRLEEAGIEVTLDHYPGGHTTDDKVPELVAYLTEAAAID